MSNPTANFGWVMPTATDLVTDLPADFAVFGQGVDTTMAGLKGGTTGQILSKTSNTDMAFTWTSPNPGDITAVTAGTGISGGGTSGDVTITNSMATAMTTSGDLIQATGSGTFARLGTGTSGQYLTTNGTTNSWGSLSLQLQETQITATGTWTVPTGITKVWVDVIGAGGGSNGRSTGAVGGAGARRTEQVTVTPGASITVTIGAGGAGGGANSDGSQGNTTTFGSTSAGGGGGGVTGTSGIGVLTVGTAQWGIGGAAGTSAPANTGAGGGQGVGTSGYAGGSGRIIIRWIG